MTAAWLLTLASGGCRDFERYDTGPNEAYCGDMVAPFSTGFLPAGTEPTYMRMRLTFDSGKLHSIPAVISTDDAADGLCAPEPLLAEVPARSISEAFHDPISELEFGDGRERNVLVWLDTGCAGTLVGVLSLMADGSIQVRLFKPAAKARKDTPRHELPGFAQFNLKKSQSDCGF